MLTALLPFLLALARSIPALDDLFRQIVTQRDQDIASEAAQRLSDKDAAVDAAIDGTATVTAPNPNAAGIPPPP